MSEQPTIAESFHEHVLSRRGFLTNAFSGLAGIGLASLLSNDLAVSSQGFSAGSRDEWTPSNGRAQFAPKAKRVLQIFCPGGASHLDLWDYKPALAKYHGKPLP